ncbi:MAG: hypothetical protein JST92_01475 [Deltaproteobacteria bacterium]|nr:hypothetical protein [Deltaproteobacteria bacterium]
MVIIGGASLALAYGSMHATKDIDTWGNGEAAFWEAVDAASKSTKMHIEVRPTPEADAPYDFETRLLRNDLNGLTHLRVFVPERHDLALMKMARGGGPDLDAIVDLHTRFPLDEKTLLLRYREMQFMGPPERLRNSFLGLISRLFGDARADALEPSVPLL